MDLLENEEELVKELCTRINAKKLKVLDVGCGTGKLSIYLNGKTGCDVTGIDKAPEKIEKARKNSDKVVFKVYSAEEMAFANSTFDVVVSLKVLHDMPNPVKALRESNRVLKESGRILIIDWVGVGIPTQVGVPMTKYFTQESNAHAKKYFTQERIEEMLSEAGFTDIKIVLNKEGELMLADGLKMGG